MFRMSFRSLQCCFLVAGMVCLGTAPGLPQTPASVLQWEKYDFARRRIRPEEIKGLSLTELKDVRGVIFGRHGRVFKEKVIQDFLTTRPWYKPNREYKQTMLNETEWENMTVVRGAEALKHATLQPGDLRFYTTRRVSASQLGKHTRAEWHIMRAEIEAVHGKRFDDEPWLQRYFSEKHWYKPNAHYDPSVLGPVERQNLTTLQTGEKRQTKLTLVPGDMGKFQKTRIDERMLRGLGLYELRLLRNEVYARRGRRFRTQWLQDYFSGQPWYRPREDLSEPSLSKVETQNIATIVGVERGIHEGLSATPVSQKLLKGLYMEDARKLRFEIYARRGKQFRERWLRDYFSSFDWYRPTSNYSAKSLSGVERRNAATILAYERQAESLMNQIEA